MLSDKGDLAGAEHALQQALRIRKATIGPTARDTLVQENTCLPRSKWKGAWRSPCRNDCS